MLELLIKGIGDNLFGELLLEGVGVISLSIFTYIFNSVFFNGIIGRGEGGYPAYRGR